MQTQEPALTPVDQDAAKTAPCDEGGVSAEEPDLVSAAGRDRWERSQRTGWYTRFDQ